MMIKRKYVCSAQICHGNGTGDKEYWNGVVTIKSWLKPNAEDLISTVRQVVVEKLDGRIDRYIDENDVQLIILNKI